MSTSTQNTPLPETQTPTAAKTFAAKPVKPARPARKTVAKSAGTIAAKPAAPAKAVKSAIAAKKTAAKPPAKPAGKSSTPRVAKPAAPAEPAAKSVKATKVKLVRDSFTMPSDEYSALGQLKQRALSFAHPAKKSELLRAGVKLLSGLSDSALLRALKNVPAIKTGRPKSKHLE